MKYSDYLDAEKSINDQRDKANNLSCEELASIDIAQMISSYEWDIKNAKRQLKKLYKAANNLPKPNKELVETINPTILKDAKWKFRGKRDLERKLYGWE